MSCPPIPPPLPRPPDDKKPAFQLPAADEFTVRKEVERLWKLIYGDNSKGLTTEPEWLTYHHVIPVAQEGPSCGLAALASAIGGGDETLGTLLNTAKELGVSRQGEMFSAEALQRVATKVGVAASEMKMDPEKLVEHITNGGLALVPYDAGPDHAPANFGGSRAHWALICGIICCPVSKKMFTVAVQGKSRRAAVWRLSLLVESNSQLREAATDKQSEDYVTFDLSSTLANRCIFLQPVLRVPKNTV